MKTRLTAAAFALMGSLLLSACGDGSVTPDPDATARLDRDSGQVILPLDDYAITRADEDVMTRARLAILRSCLQPKGHNGVAPPASAGSTEERPYGLWLPEFAASNGFALQPLGDAPDLTPPPGGWSDEADPTFNADYDECASHVMDQMESVSGPPVSTQSAAGALAVEAASLAAADPRWTGARGEWQQCLRDRGLTPEEGEGTWGSMESMALLGRQDQSSPTAQREEIRIAVIEASCNELTNLTQRLGDIEAGYQAALIKGHEAALAEEKRTTEGNLEAARAYLANNQ